MEIRDFPDKDLKTMVMKMLVKVKRTMHEHSENFNMQKTPNRNYRTEEYSNWTDKFKECFNIRLDQTEERIRNLKTGQYNSSNQRSKEWKRVKIASGTYEVL